MKTLTLIISDSQIVDTGNTSEDEFGAVYDEVEFVFFHDSKAYTAQELRKLLAL